MRTYNNGDPITYIADVVTPTPHTGTVVNCDTAANHAILGYEVRTPTGDHVYVPNDMIVEEWPGQNALFGEKTTPRDETGHEYGYQLGERIGVGYAADNTGYPWVGQVQSVATIARLGKRDQVLGYGVRAPGAGLIWVPVAQVLAPWEAELLGAARYETENEQAARQMAALRRPEQVHISRKFLHNSLTDENGLAARCHVVSKEDATGRVYWQVSDADRATRCTMAQFLREVLGAWLN